MGDINALRIFNERQLRDVMTQTGFEQCPARYQFEFGSRVAHVLFVASPHLEEHSWAMRQYGDALSHDAGWWDEPALAYYWLLRANRAGEDTGESLTDLQSRLDTEQMAWAAGHLDQGSVPSTPEYINDLSLWPQHPEGC